LSAEALRLQELFVAGMIVAIMLSVGLDLTADRLAAVFRRPAVLLVGLAVNVAAVPLLAWGIAEGLGLTPAVSAGLLLCAATPGGPIGTLLVLHARGDLALSVSLVVVMTLVSTVTAPLTLGLLGVAPPGATAPLSFGAVAETIAVYQLLPLLVGMTVRRVSPRLADRALPGASMAAKLIFGAVFVALTVLQGHRVTDLGLLPLLGVELCVLASLLLGALLTPGRASVRAAVSLNTGVRNLALALLLATVWFDDGDTILTAMIYGLLMLVTGVPFSMWWRRRTARAQG
jgi:bile acid:Na+ symporter, BASS family